MLNTKNRKRLMLSTETLRSLTAQDLSRVGGAALKTDKMGACSYSMEAVDDGGACATQATLSCASAYTLDCP